jgi:hypothetical protein
MTTISLPRPAGVADDIPAPGSHADRVAAAFRRLHESQTELACGSPCSEEADRAEAAYRDAVAEGTAEKFARQQHLIAGLRLLAEDETGLREAAGRLLCDVVGSLPKDIESALIDVRDAYRDARREVASLAVEVLDALNRVAALESIARGRAGVRS